MFEVKMFQQQESNLTEMLSLSFLSECFVYSFNDIGRTTGIDRFFEYRLFKINLQFFHISNSKQS